jgi:apolipoprotein N-acyltransferase
VRSDLVALLAGLLLPWAFSPFDVPLLAPVALSLLFASWSDATAGRAFFRGYLFGLGQFGIGVSWLYISLYQFGGSTRLEAIGCTALVTLFYALYPALAGGLAMRLAPRTSVLQRLAVLPSAWMVLEMARGWLLSGFPWLLVGASQTDTPLAGLAPLLGVYGVGWGVALLAGLIQVAVTGAGQTRRSAIIGMMLLMALSSTLSQRQWSRPAGSPFKVTLLQGNIPQDAKWQQQNRLPTLQMYMDLTRQHWDSKLIVWPETAVPVFYHQVRDSFLAPLATEARQHGSDVLIGVPYGDPAKPRPYFNALVSLNRPDDHYFKRHLVPFGEYLPLRPLFGWVLHILQIPMAEFLAGDEWQRPIVAAGYPLAASICYEDLFGHEARAQLPAAAYLVNVTNDGWFGDSIAPAQHVQVARMRALEAARYMLRATNTGVSAIIDPHGRLLAQAPRLQKTTLTGSIRPLKGQTPYVLWGDLPVFLGLLTVLGLAFRHDRLILGQHPAALGRH